MTVTGYFSNGAVEDITKDVRIYNEVATCVMNNFDVYMEYNDNSEGIGLAFTKLYIKVLAPTLELSDNNLLLGVGESKKLSAITEATGCTLTWHTTDSNVVQVDSDGNVTAVGAGSASIYAKLSCYTFKLKSDNCQVTVNVPTVETESGIVTE